MKVSKIPYASIIGSVMYTMVCTRPNLAHAISVTSRYMLDHGEEHWQALKWILKYLVKTQSYGLLFEQIMKLKKKMFLLVTVIRTTLQIWILGNLSQHISSSYMGQR